MFDLLLFPFFQLRDKSEPVVLPKPKGKFTVGRRCFSWVDTTRRELFVDDADAKREVLVWLWYPAKDTDKHEVSLYLPRKWAGRLQALGAGLPRRLELIKCNSFDNAPVDRSACPAPLVVFAPGLGDLPTSYSALAEQLASQGYFVAGIAGPYTPKLVCFPDGREVYGNKAGQVWVQKDDDGNEQRAKLISVWIEDFHFVIEKLCSLSEGSADASVASNSSEMLDGRTNLGGSEPSESLEFFAKAIDLQSVGAFGHSLGGTAAAEVPKRNQRCKATVNMHGWFAPYASDVDRHVEGPFLYLVPKLLAPHHQQLGHFEDGWQIVLDGFLHEFFGDGPLFVGPRVFKHAAKLFEKKRTLMPYPGTRAIEVTSYCVSAFFDRQLRNEGERFTLLSSEFEEATVEKLPE